MKEAEAGIPVAELIRRIGITEQTFCRWKKQYAGLDSDQARQLKQLQEENERLKKLVAELSPDLFDDGLETQSGKKLKPRVWHFAIDKDENPIQTWVCFPLYVGAVTLEEKDVLEHLHSSFLGCSWHGFLFRGDIIGSGMG